MGLSQLLHAAVTGLAAAVIVALAIAVLRRMLASRRWPLLSQEGPASSAGCSCWTLLQVAPLESGMEKADEDAAVELVAADEEDDCKVSRVSI